jgi:chromosome segregation ATPase
MSNIDKRALRKAAIHAKTVDDWGCDADNFHEKATPNAVLALLDELEAKDKRNAELNSTLERWAADRAQSASDLEAAEKRIADYQELISSLVGVSSSILREVERINKAAGGKGE